MGFGNPCDGHDGPGTEGQASTRGPCGRLTALCSPHCGVSSRLSPEDAVNATLHYSCMFPMALELNLGKKESVFETLIVNDFSLLKTKLHPS